jgi:hypothetical protein
MNTIDAVKRLERAGDENSKATKKLHQAAVTVAGIIEDQCPVNVALPRGYEVTRVKSNVGYAYFLLLDRDQYNEGRYWIDGQGSYLHGDFNSWIPGQTRAGSLRFAKDVAEGLLDEIAEFLEQRKADSENAATVLERAAEKGAV